MEVTKQTVEQFYKDVESLGLKFPVAAISKATGFSKGNVSEYLSGKEPSKNFLIKFYNAFPKSSENVPRETDATGFDAIIVLVNSNHRLAEAQDKFADSQKDISYSNKLLAENIDRLVKVNLGLPLADQVKPGVEDQSRERLVQIVASLDKSKVKELAMFLTELETKQRGSSFGGGKKRSHSS